MGLIGQLLTDLTYVLIDRRISFDESQGCPFKNMKIDKEYKIKWENAHPNNRIK